MAVRLTSEDDIERPPPISTFFGENEIEFRKEKEETQLEALKKSQFEAQLAAAKKRQEGLGDDDTSKYNEIYTTRNGVIVAYDDNTINYKCMKACFAEWRRDFPKQSKKKQYLWGTFWGTVGFLCVVGTIYWLIGYYLWYYLPQPCSHKEMEYMMRGVREMQGTYNLSVADWNYNRSAEEWEDMRKGIKLLYGVTTYCYVNKEMADRHPYFQMWELDEDDYEDWKRKLFKDARIKWEKQQAEIKRKKEEEAKAKAEAEEKAKGAN